MMRSARAPGLCGGLLALALALPATADPVPDPVPDAGCAAELALLSTFVPVQAEDPPLRHSDGTCRIEAPRLLHSPGTMNPGMTADRLIWRSAGGDPLADPPVLPTALSGEVVNPRSLFDFDDPVFDYLFDRQMRGFAIRASFDLHRDEAAGILEIRSVEIDFAGDNRIALSARIDGLDLASPETALISAMGAGLLELHLDVTTQGLFESYLLMPLGTSLLDPYGEDPALQVERLKAEAAALIETLPRPLIDAASRRSLLALLEELPNPAGRLRISFGADRVFGVEQAIGLALSGVNGLVQGADGVTRGLALTVDWQPAKDEDR